MPPDIRFECRFCNAPIYIPADQAGQRMKCPKCKNPIVAPAREGTLPRSMSPAAAPPSDAALKSRGGLGRIIVKLIILLALLALVYYAYQWWTHGGQSKVMEIKKNLQRPK